MKLHKRILALLLALSLCVVPVFAAEEEESDQYFTKWSEGLDEIMAAYIEENGLDHDRFSVGYLYTATGEYWYYNKDTLLIGGSLYKLPLNMRLTEKILEGEFSWDDTILGVPLATAQKRSIQYSDNPISEAMQKFLVGIYSGYYYPYRTEIAKYSGPFKEDIPAQYYSGNYFNAEFMLHTLSYLYQHSDIFADILGYMKEAMPGWYFKKYQSEYEIAHKYGSVRSSMNDVGIVYTPNPFFLVVMTDGVPGAERILGELCQLMTEYTLSLDAKYEAERQAAIDEVEQLAAAADLAELAASEMNRDIAQFTAMTETAAQTVTELTELIMFSTLRLGLP